MVEAITDYTVVIGCNLYLQIGLPRAIMKCMNDTYMQQKFNYALYWVDWYDADCGWHNQHVPAEELETVLAGIRAVGGHIHRCHPCFSR